MNKTEKEILKKIKTGEIKMKPRWKFIVEVWELRGLCLIMVLATGLSILAITYFLEIYNPGELAEFEGIGWQVFWEDFPYYWLLGVVVFLVLSIKLWLNLGENYRKTKRIVVLITGIVVMMLTVMVLWLKKLLL